MNENHVEISDAYRTSRRNTSVLCGIGLAWSAAQFEIDKISLPNIGEVTLSASSIPVIIGIMCIYSAVRCTLEYMMQPVGARRAGLAQIDYTITIYMVRLTVVALAASLVTRSWMSIFFILVAVMGALIFFFVASYILMFVLMPVRMWLRSLSGRRSVASAAIEATSYSFALSWFSLALLIILMGTGLLNPFPLLGEAYRDISAGQLAAFSFVCLIVLLTIYFEREYFNMVFSYIPPMIEKKYIEDGRTIYSQEANPKHPEYEKLKESIQPFKYSVMEAGDNLKKPHNADE